MKITIGTYTKKESKGIYTIELHDKLWNINMIHQISHPTYLTKLKDTLFTVVQGRRKRRDCGFSGICSSRSVH
jgi:6-phosphogluconolactonase (cycloisomerase 2 family)